MKNLFKNKLTALAVLATVFFASCGDKDPVNLIKPEIKVASVKVDGKDVASKSDVEAGSDVKFELSATSKTTLTAVFLKINDENQPNVYSSAADKDVDINKISYTFKADDKYIDKEVKFMFIAQDSLKQKDTAMFELKVVKTAKDAKKLAPKLTVVLGGGASKSFYSISEGKLYSDNDVKGTTAAISKKIDLVYYYGATTNKSSLAGPKSLPKSVYDITKTGSNWGTLNDTKLVKTSITSLEGITTVGKVNEKLKGLTIDKGVITKLAKGDILAFKTVGGISGFITVKSITGTGGSDGSISLDIITNQEAPATVSPQ